jgi:hypothetical protein
MAFAAAVAANSDTSPSTHAPGNPNPRKVSAGEVVLSASTAANFSGSAVARLRIPMSSVCVTGYTLLPDRGFTELIGRTASSGKSMIDFAFPAIFTKASKRGRTRFMQAGEISHR